MRQEKLGAGWDLSTQKILVCFEMAQDFANLYRGYGLTYTLLPHEHDKANEK